MTLWAGFDVGGHAVKAVVVDEAGAIVARGRRETGLDIDATGLGSAIGALLRELGESRELGNLRLPTELDELGRKAEIAPTVGIGLAGVMGADGILHGSPNMPRLVGEPMREHLERILERPTVVDNDANCAAYGEGLGGAAEGVDDYLLITIGSGIGSGLVLGGKLHHGSTGYACELGHSVVVQGGRRCGCGNRGCLEAYVSESAARAYVGEVGGALGEAVERTIGARGYGYAQSLFELAADGDREAGRIASEMVASLGTGLASAINVLDVTTIVLGGGIAPAILDRRDELMNALEAFLFARSVAAVSLVAAAHGADAGALGAARLAMSGR